MRLKKYILVLIVGIAILFALNPSSKSPIDEPIDLIVVYKSKRLLNVYAHERLLRSYKISLGKHPIGHKEFEGDKKTPEGLYYINTKSTNSRYHKNLGISYPNINDLNFATNRQKSAGGNIKIHGIRNWLGLVGILHRNFDWTNGCIALTNQEIDELYDVVPVGTIIEIKP